MCVTIYPIRPVIYQLLCGGPMKEKREKKSCAKMHMLSYIHT